MVWKRDDPEGDEAGKIKYLAVPYTRGYGLDIGCGPFKAFPHFIGVDTMQEWKTGNWRPDIPLDGTKLKMFADNSLNFVFSSHFLEHVDKPGDVLKEWWRVIAPGGHLVLYLPHADLYPRMGQPGSNPDHKSDFVPDDIIALMRKAAADLRQGWDLVENETRDGGREYSFFQVYQKRADLEQNLKPWQRPLKSCLVVRYGGFGDMVMTASVLPLLKEQGYHITLNTTDRGRAIMKADPNIDAWLMQDPEQVPNVDLGEYWAALATRYDRVVNLSESVEGGLLAFPGRIGHSYPHDVRHKLLNVNYLERTHDIAGVPHVFAPKFHHTEQEMARTERERKKYGDKPVVVWVLAGSSVHKAYPWTDRVVARLLLRTDVTVITVGNHADQILEIGVCQELLKNGPAKLPYEETHKLKFADAVALVEKHYGKGRYIPRAGAWNIRETMTFAKIADCVVGPETGVMNAVSFEPVGKVVMLSHSSHENLTKHWVNTIAFEPTNCPEAPCHRMHYSREYCPEDENSGASKCAAAVRPGDLFDAITELLLLGPSETAKARTWASRALIAAAD